MSLSELFKDLQVVVQTAIKLENTLKDDTLYNDLKRIMKTAKKGFTDATGGALYRVHVHETKPSIDALKEMIQGIPGAPSFKNGKDQLPIQSVAWKHDAVKYIPILVKEGIKHEVGGRGIRGGLLVLEDPKDWFHNKSALQLLFDDRVINQIQSLTTMLISIY